MTYHVRKNEGRYRLLRHHPLKEKNRGTCGAGSGCPNPAGYVASSPSFEAKRMCAFHASQWALRHRIAVPS